MSRKKVLTGTMHVGLLTLASRFFGIIREVLTVKYLGVSGCSDAFLTAFKIPNSLRKIFAEGALSAAFIPHVVRAIKKNGHDSVTGLMTCAFLLFEGFVLIVCCVVMMHAEWVIRFIAPGFAEFQVADAVPMLRIVMPFIFFVSSSALLAGALQAVDRFFVPAFSQIVINIIFIAGLLICIAWQLPVTILCWFIVAGGAAQLGMHLFVYWKSHFRFGMPTQDDIKKCLSVCSAFLLCLPSMSMNEVALFIDTSFASYLAPGSISLIYYANRFVGIPLGVFAVAFSTILLPHFSRLTVDSPRRLHFYLLESAQFIVWVTLPITFLMIFFAHDIFSTIFLSEKFTAAHVVTAAHILIVFTTGLFFFSLNKIILTIFYAMHATWVPALVALGATLMNIVLNMFFINRFQAIGLAAATTVSAIAQTCIFLWVLQKFYHYRLYLSRFCEFIMRYAVQVSSFGCGFIALYYLLSHLIVLYCPPAVAAFLLYKIGLWGWVGPLSAFYLFLLWYFRSFFKINLYFVK